LKKKKKKEKKKMESFTAFATSVGNSITEAATAVGQKVERLAEDYHVSEKLNSLGEASEEKFTIISGLLIFASFMFCFQMVFIWSFCFVFYLFIQQQEHIRRW
jgi:hypothetical protein